MDLDVSSGRQHVDALVRRQHGVVAAWQVRELGLPRSTFVSVTRGGVQLARGVRLVSAARLDLHARVAAAVLAGGPTALATSGTALWLHGLERRPPSTVHVAIPETCRARSAGDDVRYLRTRTLEPRDHGVARGIPCATIPRAFLDMAKERHGRRLRAALLAAAQRERLPWQAVLWRALDARFSTGRQLLLRNLRDLDPAACDSILVARFRDRLVAAGVVPDRVPAEVDVGGRVLHPDVTFEANRVAIECDGFAFHSTPAALDVDHRKSNAYQVAGWTILRITWDRMDADWPAFLAELLALIR